MVEVYHQIFSKQKTIETKKLIESGQARFCEVISDWVAHTIDNI